MKRELTATVYITDESQVLLIYHKKLKKWLPPGGHVDQNELPCMAAIREAKEETGLDVELLSEDNVTINESNAISLARPYLCLLEEIPEHKGEPAHQHIDMVYRGKVIGGTVIHNGEETEDIRWFSLDDLAKLKPEDEIYNETLSTIRNLL